MRGSQVYPGLAIILAVSACIPAGVPDQRAGQAVTSNLANPQLDTDMDAILGAEPNGQTPAQTLAQTPAWSPAAVRTDAARVPSFVYVVQPGDTLRGIGNRTGAGAEAIARANMLAPPYVIRPGQQLAIPAGRYHLVQTGETGIAIARAYGVGWGDVVDANGLAEPFILRVGQRLLLPGGANSGAEPTLEDRAAAFTINIDDIVSGSQPAISDATRTAPPLSSGSPNGASGSGASGAIAEPASFAGRFAWPLAGPIQNKFGPMGNGKVNSGIDIAAPRGTPVRTAAAGVISYAGNEIAVYGGLVLVTHGGGWISAYGHLDRIDVVRGQSVKPGEVIGLSGATGQVQTPQLHFELRKNRKSIDPVGQLPPR